MSEDLEKILFAIDIKGNIFPLYASGRAVEWQVYEDSDTDWNCTVDISGVPAEPGLYVWEGIPHPEYESEEGAGTYIIGYRYDNNWRHLDQLEWLALMENSCPWASKSNEKEGVPPLFDWPNFTMDYNDRTDQITSKSPQIENKITWVCDYCGDESKERAMPDKQGFCCRMGDDSVRSHDWVPTK